MFNGVQSGRVGSIVGFKRDSALAPQGIRPFVAPSNPQTLAQATQRARFAGVSLFMSMLYQIADHNVEGTKVGRWNRRAFSKLLFGDKSNVIICAKGAQVLALDSDASAAQSVKIAKGTLGKVVPTTNATPTALGVLDAQKIADAGLQTGDIITIVRGIIGNGNLTGVAYKQYQVAEGVEINDLGLTFSEGVWSAEFNAECFGVIIERNGNSKHLLTTSVMAKVPKFSASNTAACYETYQGSESSLKNNKFLYGEDFEVNPSPAAAVTMRNLVINGESLTIGGTRQMLTTAALTGSVEVINLGQDQEAVAALGNYSEGDPVTPGSAIGQFGHGSISMSHAAFGNAGTQHIWLMIDGYAYRKIATLTIVAPPFETSISSLSIDGASVAKNAQKTVNGQSITVAGNISAYEAGHSIGVGFSTANMVAVNSTSFSGTLNNVPQSFTPLKLFVDGVAVETWCQVKTTYTPPAGFSDLTYGGNAWNSDQDIQAGTEFSAITGNYSGPNTDNITLMKSSTKPLGGAEVEYRFGAFNLASDGTIITSRRDELGEGNYWLVAGYFDPDQAQTLVRVVFDYKISVSNE